jgi:enoyl-CoA hydratase/carnithine racemase
MKVIEGLWKTFERLSMDGRVGAVIITGIGKVFIAGVDIAMFESFINDRQQGREAVKKSQDCFTCIENFPRIVIAAVNGLGRGGCELATACDVRIAAENAQFGVPEVRLGVIPGAGGTQRLSRLLGKRMAKMMVLGGEAIGALEAFRIGLVEKGRARRRVDW